jgi:hypothetical protein
MHHSIYEHKVDVHENLIRRAVDMGTRMNDRDTLSHVTRSTLKRKKCVSKLKADILNIC